MSDIPIYDMPQNSDEFRHMWEQAQNDLGHNDMNMRRDRPYYGQPHTDLGVRGMTGITGITFRDLRDCFVRAVCLAAAHQSAELYAEAEKGESAALCENDLYKLDLSQVDIMAVCQGLSCEVEKIMGIYPNVGMNTGGPR